jgi:hypothetical protein
VSDKHPVPLFPVDDALRKMLPVYKQLTRYFPRSFREITKVSVVNNVRYNPDRSPNDINWARGKSPHQLDSALKHMMEHADGKIFDMVDPEVAKATGIDRIYILAQAAWRIQAELELLIEKVEREEHAAANSGPIPSPLPNNNVFTKCKCGKCDFAKHPGDLPPSIYDMETGTTHTEAECWHGAHA